MERSVNDHVQAADVGIADTNSVPHDNIRLAEVTHRNLSDLLSSSARLSLLDGPHICSAPAVICSVDDLEAARLDGVCRWQVLNASS